jgi:hypothetical protein
MIVDWNVSKAGGQVVSTRTPGGRGDRGSGCSEENVVLCIVDGSIERECIGR